jgi:hypothetical protein
MTGSGLLAPTAFLMRSIAALAAAHLRRAECRRREQGK